MKGEEMGELALLDHDFLDRLDKELKTIWKHISELHCKVAELQAQITVLRELIKSSG